MTAGALAVLLSASACGGSEPATEPGGVEKIRVGTIPVPSAVPLHLGIEQGFFEEENLEIELVSGAGFAPALAQVVNGENQFGFAATMPLIVAASKGAPVHVVAQTAVTTEESIDTKESAIVVLANSSIQGPADLVGKKVAVNALGGVADIGVRLAVEKAGGDPDAVTYVELPSAQASAALKGGRVDASIMPEPFATEALNAGGFRQIGSYTSGFPEGSAFAVAFASRQFVSENPDVVARFQRAMEKSVAYTDEHPDEARAALAKFTDIPAGVVSDLDLNPYSADIDLESLKELHEILKRFGVLTAPLDMEELVVKSPPK